MCRFLVCCLGLLVRPSIGAAQEGPAAAPDSYRFYLGLGANTGRYRVMDDYLSGTGQHPRLSTAPVLTAGVQLSPRWALQVRASAYRQHRSYYSEDLDYSTTPGRPQRQVLAGTYGQRTLVVPVLARYTFRHDNPRRLHSNVLAGIAAYRIRRQNAYTVQDSAGNVLYDIDSDQRFVRLQLWSGLGLQYRLTPHLELAGEVMVRLENLGYFFRPHVNAGAELRYRFGRLKS